MRRGQQTHRIRTKALQNKEIKSIKVFYLILNQNTIRGMKKKHKEKHRTKAQGKIHIPCNGNIESENK